MKYCPCARRLCLCDCNGNMGVVAVIVALSDTLESESGIAGVSDRLRDVMRVGGRG